MAIQLTSPQDVASYLNTTQEALNEVGTYDPLEDGSVDKFMEDKLGMTTPMPQAPKYLETYKQMREELGLSQLEQNMMWYKDAIRREELLLNQQKNYMREQPVRLGVIEGRVDKATRDRQEQIQWYSNELSRVSDMVQSAYNQINLIMQFTQMDYETAKDQYETEFNNRMNVYKVITDQYNADRAFASTQWSMIASYISKGQTSWDQFTPDQKAQVAKYEAIMGMPIGFMSTLKMEAGANVITTSQRVGSDGYQYVDMIIQGADGKPKVQSIRTGKVKTSGGGSGGSSKMTTLQKQAVEHLANLEKSGQMLSHRGGTDNEQMPDKLMADWEIDQAIASFKKTYGSELGMQLFNYAWETGGYKEWRG